MNDNPRFSFSNFGWWRSSKTSEFEALLELQPKAAFLADTQTRHILFANSKAAELTAFTRQELAGLHLHTLFAKWEEGFLDLGLADDHIPVGQQVKELTRRNGTKVEVQVAYKFLPPKGKRLLIILEQNQPDPQHAEVLRLNQLLDSLRELASTPQNNEFEAAIKSALAITHALTRAGIIGVYLSGTKPDPRLLTTWGASDLLPAEFPSNDLVHLRKPNLWIKGKRSTSSLHHAAREHRLSYLATAPLGQPKALIGLVVVADSKVRPPENLLQFLQILAATLTTIIQHNALATKMQESLQEQDKLLTISRTMEESVQEGLLVLAPDLTALKLNPAAEMMLGYASKEVYKQPIENFLIGTETLIPALTAAQNGSATYSLGNVRLYRRSGDAFLAHMSTLPLMHKEELQNIVILITDLSEQEQVREHTQQLEQRAVLGEVMAIFAHEVRNPINNISTGLQWMAMSLPAGDPKQETISRLQQDCDRLEELMKYVLSFSRPTEYKMERLNLGTLIQHLLERMHPRMARVNVTYDLQLDPDCPPIEGDWRALEQVFNNLINNVVQAMSEKGGRLVLKIQRFNSPEGLEFVEASVVDTGPGISKEIQDRIFQPFFTTNRNGTGLGLAISKRIVTAHKGNIRLESFPGGTVFQVQIPAVVQ